MFFGFDGEDNGDRRGGNVGIAAAISKARGESEGNLFWVFLAFPSAPSFPPRSGIFVSGGLLHQALRLEMPLSNFCLACCIAIAASVSDCSAANLFNSFRLTPGRRYPSHSGI